MGIGLQCARTSLNGYRCVYLISSSSQTGSQRSAVRTPSAFRNRIPKFCGEPSLSQGVRCNTIMIGDSITDIRTARAAGVPVIAVDFGYSERPIAELGPHWTISHFAQLPASIAAISSAI